jgi:hypothetical protein
MQHNPKVFEQARKKMGRWHKNDGGFSAPDTGPGPCYQDMHPKINHDPGHQNVEVSLPNILSIADTAPDSTSVTIGKGFANFNAANFGNPAAVTISYISNNPLVPFTYGQFPGTSWGAALHTGLIHVRTVTANQASQSLFVLRNPGAPKFEGIYAMCRFTLAGEREIREQQLTKI